MKIHKKVPKTLKKTFVKKTKKGRLKLKKKWIQEKEFLE